jgi:Fe-S-cluster containining protein
MDSSCDCELCQKACKRKPGWFLPSQVKDIEQFFNKSLKELLGHELAIDWFEDFEDLGILILAPNIKENNQDIQYPYDNRGACVLQDKEGKCTIYPIRPYECRELSHQDDHDDIETRHKFVAMEWKKSNILKEYEWEVIIYEPDSFMESMFGLHTPLDLN